MLRAPCYLISDAHLGVASVETERALVRFLRALPARAASLVINGDLFDFWFEWRSVIPRGSFRALSALADVSEAGVQVVFVAGNHDCWGGDVLRRDVGVSYHEGAWEGEIAGWRTRVEHGDGLRGREDRPYRALRAVLRNPLAVRLFRTLHPDWGTRLAMGSSHASRSYRARDGGAALRAVALGVLASRPDLDLLVFGHTHVATLERAPGGGVYANAGSWLDAPTLLRVTENSVELVEWDGSAEGRRLHRFERRAEKALTEL